MSRIVKENLIIGLNSKDSRRLNGSSLSNVVFDFKGIITSKNNYTNLKIQLIDAVIPYSFYNINENNNLLVVNNVKYFLTLGNYNQVSLFKEFNEILPDFALMFIRLTGKISFASTSAFIFNKESTIFNVLGFDENVDFISDNNNFLTALYPLYLIGVNNIKIASQALSCNISDSFHNNNGNILSFISVNAPPQGLIHYSSHADRFFPLKNQFIEEIDIQIYDGNNNFIDFNNRFWSLTIAISYEKKIFDNTLTNLQDIKNIMNNLLVGLGKDEGKDVEKEEEKEENNQPQPLSLDETDLDFLLYQNGIYI
jgi:hypothetical protein